MEWNEKLQQIIDYVEIHLQRKEEPIQHAEIAKMAGCSFDFFQKVFSYMNGISFAEYIRSRKLTLAGYDSPTSFTKAFQHFYSVSPKKAREKQVELQVMPKMQIIHSAKYSWRLERKGCLVCFSLVRNRLMNLYTPLWLYLTHYYRRALQR